MNDLIVYQDANYGGSMLCFYGRGVFNLTQITMGCWTWPWCSSWNDQISSFSTGWYWGHFAWDINNQGAWYFFSPNQNVPYVGNIWNDQISSVEVDGP